MRILVTGAAGFMGSYLLEYLIDEGHHMIGIDNYSIGTFKHESIYEADLVEEKEKVTLIIQSFKPEIVYHLAAWAHEGLSQFAPIKITENNYNAFLNVLTPSINAGVKRFVTASSMSVYGDQIPPFDETMDTKPADVYAVAKTAMERTLKIMAEVHGFEHVIVRPHNVYGPRQSLSDPYRNVVGIFINRMLAGKKFFIYGDGDQTRAFSYIDDVIPYFAKCGFEDIDGEIINIGPVEEYSINHLASEVMKNFDNPPKPEYVADRPLEVKHAFCTNDKAIKLLGYETSTQFSEGVVKMVKWAKEKGAQKTIYLDELEIVNDKTPITWLKKKI